MLTFCPFLSFRVEYPTGEEIIDDPELRNNVLNNYRQRHRIKQRLNAIIVPESTRDILIGQL